MHADAPPIVSRSQRSPTPRQIYALAAALCEQTGERFPTTLAEASTRLERLRTALGHPAPHLVDRPPPRRRRRGAAEKLASAIAAGLRVRCDEEVVTRTCRDN
jgi:hypothetical protein